MQVIKAIIIGVSIVAAAFILRTAPSADGNGRYQVGGSSGDVFVLDTKTGDLWQKFAPIRSSGSMNWEKASGPWTKTE